MIETTTIVTLRSETCCQCGMLFGLSSNDLERLRRTHETFWCPSGHPQNYVGKTDLQIAQEQAQRERARADRAAADAKHQRDRRQSVERSLTATRGHMTRIKKRIKSGACPCCHEQFANLGRHMQSQHPGYGGAEKERHE